jgi:hypothetical protein
MKRFSACFLLLDFNIGFCAIATNTTNTYHIDNRFSANVNFSL